MSFWSSPQFWQAAIGGATSLINNMTKPKEHVPYNQTQAAFDAQQQLAREQMAQDMLIAQMKLEAGGGGGGGGGSAIEAAKINAATQLQQMKLNAILQAAKQEQESRSMYLPYISEAQKGVTGGIAERGRLGQQGFIEAGRLLGSFKR